MQRLYFGSCINKRESAGVTDIQGLSLLAIAVSHDEAIGVLVRKAREMYPATNGWSIFAPAMFVIDQRDALKVAYDNYNAITQ